MHELSDEELKRLYDASLWVIKASYDARGATIRDYEMPDGTKGDYKFKFKVYSQRKDPLGYVLSKRLRLMVALRIGLPKSKFR